jgi:hypothetical protein
MISRNKYVLQPYHLDELPACPKCGGAYRHSVGVGDHLRCRSGCSVAVANRKDGLYRIRSPSSRHLVDEIHQLISLIGRNRGVPPRVIYRMIGTEIGSSEVRLGCLSHDGLAVALRVCERELNISYGG